ncbi:hypothetical protein [Nostoc linckia]|jgi:hypothetical protein|uniref:hypothetical protein n=1 Tax=Nostoc linckia TaxID=92942 RepID=UPI0015D4D76D|nr:hypothetical protein [Nostoc linckia]
MSKKNNIIQQNKRRKKRGLKPRRSGWFLSVMLVPSLQPRAQSVPHPMATSTPQE